MQYHNVNSWYWREQIVYERSLRIQRMVAVAVVVVVGSIVPHHSYVTWVTMVVRVYYMVVWR